MFRHIPIYERLLNAPMIRSFPNICDVDVSFSNQPYVELLNLINIEEGEQRLKFFDPHEKNEGFFHLIEQLAIAYYYRGTERHIKNDLDKSLKQFISLLEMHYGVVKKILSSGSNLLEITEECRQHIKSIGKISHYLGRLYQHFGSLGLAERYLNIDLKISAGFISQLQDEDPRLVKSCLYLAQAYMTLKLYGRAIPLLELTISAQQQLNSSDWRTGESYYNLMLAHKELIDDLCVQMRKNQNDQELKQALMLKINFHFSHAEKYYIEAMRFFAIDSPYCVAFPNNTKPRKRRCVLAKAWQSLLFTKEHIKILMSIGAAVEAPMANVPDLMCGPFLPYMQVRHPISYIPIPQPQNPNGYQRVIPTYSMHYPQPYFSYMPPYIPSTDSESKVSPAMRRK